MLSTILQLILWSSLILIFYTYIGYPLLLKAISLISNKALQQGNITPFATLIISAHNEEKIIQKKILNSLAINYPRERLEIIVVSDGSTDSTNDIVLGYRGKGIILSFLKEQKGKTKALNNTVPKARGDIIVFTDANALLEKDALKELVKHFSQRDIGFVTGNTKYISHKWGGTSEVTGFYTKYEIFIKKKESTLGSCVGADGAIFAIRKELYEMLKDTDINDFTLPLKIIRKGYRGVLEQEAISLEESSSGIKGEFKRQTRITNRTLRAIFSNIDLLNPFKFPLFSLELASHKLLRFISPFLLFSLLISNIFLLHHATIYLLMLLAQSIFYALAIFGCLMNKIVKNFNFFSAPYYFFWINIAIFLGWIRYLSGTTDVTWQPERG